MKRNTRVTIQAHPYKGLTGVTMLVKPVPFVALNGVRSRVVQVPEKYLEVTQPSIDSLLVGDILKQADKSMWSYTRKKTTKVLAIQGSCFLKTRTGNFAQTGGWETKQYAQDSGWSIAKPACNWKDKEQSIVEQMSDILGLREDNLEINDE